MRVFEEIWRALRKVDKATETLARSAYPPSVPAIVSHMTDSEGLPGQLGSQATPQFRNIQTILRNQEERQRIQRQWLRKYNPLKEEDEQDQRDKN